MRKNAKKLCIKKNKFEECLYSNKQNELERIDQKMKANSQYIADKRTPQIQKNTRQNMYSRNKSDPRVIKRDTYGYVNVKKVC